jgi:hypothetical protein
MIKQNYAQNANEQEKTQEPAKEMLKMQEQPKVVKKQLIPDGAKSFQVISHFKDGFFFNTIEIDEEGNKVFATDANGNSKIQKYKMWQFSKVHVKDPETGKVSSKLGYCTFVASEEHHGRYFPLIVKELNKLAKDVSNKLFSMDGHFEKRNPEAFRINEKLKVKDSEINELKTKNEELMKRLGFNK